MKKALVEVWRNMYIRKKKGRKQIALGSHQAWVPWFLQNCESSTYRVEGILEREQRSLTGMEAADSSDFNYHSS